MIKCKVILGLKVMIKRLQHFAGLVIGHEVHTAAMTRAHG